MTLLLLFGGALQSSNRFDTGAGQWSMSGSGAVGATTRTVGVSSCSIAFAGKPTAAKGRTVATTLAAIAAQATAATKKNGVQIGPVTDTWTGTNGAVWDSSIWRANTDGGTRDIQSNGGRQLTPASNGFGTSAPGAVRHPNDFELTIDVTATTIASIIQLGYRTSAAPDSGLPSDPSYGYLVQTTTSTGAVSLFKKLAAGGSGSITGGTASFGSITAGDVLHFRVRAQGNKHWVRIWKNAAGEPSTWDINGISDSDFSMGALWLGTRATSAVAQTAVWDNLSMISLDFALFSEAGTAVTTKGGVRLSIGSFAFGGSVAAKKGSTQTVSSASVAIAGKVTAAKGRVVSTTTASFSEAGSVAAIKGAVGASRAAFSVSGSVTATSASGTHGGAGVVHAAFQGTAAAIKAAAGASQASFALQGRGTSATTRGPTARTPVALSVAVGAKKAVTQPNASSISIALAPKGAVAATNRTVGTSSCSVAFSPRGSVGSGTRTPTARTPVALAGTVATTTAVTKTGQAQVAIASRVTATKAPTLIATSSSVAFAGRAAATKARTTIATTASLAFVGTVTAVKARTVGASSAVAAISGRVAASSTTSHVAGTTSCSVAFTGTVATNGARTSTTGRAVVALASTTAAKGSHVGASRAAVALAGTVATKKGSTGAASTASVAFTGRSVAAKATTPASRLAVAFAGTALAAKARAVGTTIASWAFAGTLTAKKGRTSASSCSIAPAGSSTTFKNLFIATRASWAFSSAGVGRKNATSTGNEIYVLAGTVVAIHPKLIFGRMAFAFTGRAMALRDFVSIEPGDPRLSVDGRVVIWSDHPLTQDRVETDASSASVHVSSDPSKAKGQAKVGQTGRSAKVSVSGKSGRPRVTIDKP